MKKLFVLLAFLLPLGLRASDYTMYNVCENFEMKVSKPKKETIQITERLYVWKSNDGNNRHGARFRYFLNDYETSDEEFESHVKNGELVVIVDPRRGSIPR